MKKHFFLLFSCIFFLFSCKTPKDSLKNQTISTKDSVWVYDFTVRMALDLMPHEEGIGDSLRPPVILQWSVREGYGFWYPYLFYTAFQKKCAEKKMPGYIEMIQRLNAVQDSITRVEDEETEGRIIRCFGTPIGSTPDSYRIALVKQRLFYYPLTHTVITKILSVTPLDGRGKPFYTIDFSKIPQNIPLSTQDTSLTFVKQFNINTNIKDFVPVNGEKNDWWAHLLAFSQQDTTRLISTVASPYSSERITQMDINQMWHPIEDSTWFHHETYEEFHKIIKRPDLQVSDCNKIRFFQTFYFKANSFELIAKPNFIAPVIHYIDTYYKARNYWQPLYWIKVE